MKRIHLHHDLPLLDKEMYCDSIYAFLTIEMLSPFRIYSSGNTWGKIFLVIASVNPFIPHINIQSCVTRRFTKTTT